MPKEEKEIKLKERKNILEKVKSFIDSNLNPRFNNILCPEEPNYKDPGTITEILENLDITKEGYENALSISPDDRFQIHFRRIPNSCIVNNYFVEGLTLPGLGFFENITAGGRA